MPRGDGTGPMGMGPMTGRGAGYCAGFTKPGFLNLFSRPGLGLGLGRGRRYRPYYSSLGSAYPAKRGFNRNRLR